MGFWVECPEFSKQLVLLLGGFDAHQSITMNIGTIHPSYTITSHHEHLARFSIFFLAQQTAQLQWLKNFHLKNVGSAEDGIVEFDLHFHVYHSQVNRRQYFHIELDSFEYCEWLVFLDGEPFPLDAFGSGKFSPLSALRCFCDEGVDVGTISDGVVGPCESI
jgi:hypothetical protein